MAFDAQWLKTRVVASGSAFRGPHDGRRHFGIQTYHKPSKWPSIGTFERSRTDSRRMTSWKTYVIGVARRNWSIGVYYL